MTAWADKMKDRDDRVEDVRHNRPVKEFFKVLAKAAKKSLKKSGDIEL